MNSDFGLETGGPVVRGLAPLLRIQLRQVASQSTLVASFPDFEHQKSRNLSDSSLTVASE